jgi:hypothetical protein
MMMSSLTFSVVSPAFFQMTRAIEPAKTSQARDPEGGDQVVVAVGVDLPVAAARIGVPVEEIENGIAHVPGRRGRARPAVDRPVRKERPELVAVAERRERPARHVVGVFDVLEVGHVPGIVERRGREVLGIALGRGLGEAQDGRVDPEKAGEYPVDLTAWSRRDDHGV